MNITVDRNATIKTLLKAKKRLFGKDVNIMNALIIQIGTCGGKLN